jgi:DNA-binding LytR/AlgR family response regulator
MQPWFNGDYIVILRDGTRLTLSRGYRDRVQRKLGR